MNGDLVGSLLERVSGGVEPGAYVERPGLDDRLASAGANVASVRRLLGLGRR